MSNRQPLLHPRASLLSLAAMAAMRKCNARRWFGSVFSMVPGRELSAKLVHPGTPGKNVNCWL
mgnify:CR=1 FL=1